MILRPVDENDDILPVLSSSVLLKGAPAIARLSKDRLDLLNGDWWENSAWGNALVDMLKEGRFTENDIQALSSYITSYLRETPGVVDVRDAAAAVDGRRFSYTCTVDTEDGTVDLVYNL